MKTNLIYKNSIMGFAVGDALGAPAEFGERWMRDMDPVKEMRSGGIFEVPAGGWTDDTSMTIAALISLRNGFDPKDMLDRFDAWLRAGEYTWNSEPIGIGKQILRVLLRYEQEHDPLTCGSTAEEENGNGSLMRILPVCLYGYQLLKHDKAELTDILEMIHTASALTHAHIRSKLACGLYFFILCAILDERGTLCERIQSGLGRGFSFYDRESELCHYARLADLDTFKTTHRDQIQSSGYVVHTLEAAVWCLLNADTYKDSVLLAVNLGLDTDTIAALAGALAGLYYGYDSIPQEWLAVLKERDRLLNLCDSFDNRNDTQKAGKP